MSDRKTCGRKRRFKSKEAACIAVRRQKNCALNVYKCPLCGAWHIGKTNDPFRRAKRIDQLLERAGFKKDA